MNPTLWFIVPAYGRQQLAAICLRQLRRTCDALTAAGIDATAVVIADDSNLETARELGFVWVERDNQFTSRKFNDGIQLACDPAYADALSPLGRWRGDAADYVVPCGSDDWVDHRILLDLPDPNTIVGFQFASFVREDGQEMTAKHLNYSGGCGIRIYPRELMEPLGYRPADEDRERGCDTSILINVQTATPEVRLHHPLIDPRSIVDWKTSGQQLNSYRDLSRHRTLTVTHPFEALAGFYPNEALEEMERHYAEQLVAA